MAWIQDAYDKIFDPSTECVAFISFGKDSLAMLRAIKLLGLPLHRIIHTEVWATQEIPADLPPMVEFKSKADKIIRELYGIDVEHICAAKDRSHVVHVERERERERERASYADYFYRRMESGNFAGNIYGFPCQKGSWCKKLKYEQIDIRGYILSTFRRRKTSRNNIRFPVHKRELVPKPIKGHKFSVSPGMRGKKNIVRYLGIAADEPIRIERHIQKPDVILPLVEIGWDEALCGLVSKYQDLLSPTYETSMRGGCWFCHNQGVDQLRQLRRNYPDLWALLLKWDSDSPVTFKADGHTVHDFDARFALEDDGWISVKDPWKWAYLDDMPIQMRLQF